MLVPASTTKTMPTPLLLFLLLLLLPLPSPVSSAKVPRRNLSVLDRMPQGGMGKRNLGYRPYPFNQHGGDTNNYPARLHALFLQRNNELNPGSLLGLGNLPVAKDPSQFNTSPTLNPSKLDLQDFYDLGSLLRVHYYTNKNPLYTKEMLPLQQIDGNWPMSSSRSSNGRVESLISRDGSAKSGRVKDTRYSGDSSDEDMTAASKAGLVFLEDSLPRTSKGRRERRGWVPRKGRWGRDSSLGGKRQVRLDRMPMAYGRKRAAGMEPAGEDLLLRAGSFSQNL